MRSPNLILRVILLAAWIASCTGPSPTVESDEKESKAESEKIELFGKQFVFDKREMKEDTKNLPKITEYFFRMKGRAGCLTKETASTCSTMTAYRYKSGRNKKEDAAFAKLNAPASCEIIYLIREDKTNGRYHFLCIAASKVIYIGNG